eukprot:Em0008g182a
MAVDWIAVCSHFETISFSVSYMLSESFASHLYEIFNSGGDANSGATRTLSNVKDSFDSFKRKAISYVQASGEAASFVCETAVIKDVADDIKNNQSTEKLVHFIDDMIRRLKRCEACLSDLEKVEMVLQNHLDNAVEQAEEKCRIQACAANEKARSERERQQSGLALAGKVVLGAGAVVLGAVALFSGASVLAAGLSIIASGAPVVTSVAPIAGGVAVTLSPAAGIAVAGAGAAALGAGAVVKGGGAVVQGVGTVATGIWGSLYSTENMQVHLIILAEAKRQIVQIHEDRCKAKIELQNIQVNLVKVKRYIEGESHINVKGLREEARNPSYKETSDGQLVLRKYCKILTNLDGLKESDCRDRNGLHVYDFNTAATLRFGYKVVPPTLAL